MRFITSTLATLFIACLIGSCTSQPDAETIFKSLKDGEAVFVVTMNGESFYPDSSRFTGAITISPNTIHMDLTDQIESNVILSFSNDSLFIKRPVKCTIDVDHQSAGSVMIGRVRDKKRRTGDGYLMAAGGVLFESISEQKVVVRLSGKTGNFNTLNDKRSWKTLEGLLICKRPKITMRGGATKSLLY